MRLFTDTDVPDSPGTAGSCNSAQGKKQGDKKKGDGKHCLLCSKPGHDKENCIRNPSEAKYNAGLPKMIFTFRAYNSCFFGCFSGPNFLIFHAFFGPI